MAKLLLAALALCCCLGLSAAAGRSLLLTDAEAQAQLKGVDQAAGQLFSQISDAVASSGVLTPPSSSSDYSSQLHDKTIDYINHHAPLWKSDAGYFIRPQISSALYNAANHLEQPAAIAALAPAGAPAEGPAAAAAQPAQTAPTTSEGGRRLLQSPSAFSSAADAGAPGPALFDGAAAPDAELYTSLKKKKKNAGTDAAASAGTTGAVSSVNGVPTKQLAAETPTTEATRGSASAQAANTAATTSLSQDLQPKAGSTADGVSLDPNLPNALPGPLRLATQQQAKTTGYQAQPTTAYTATDGTAFAGTPVDKLPGPLRIDATTPFDGPSVSGSEISLILGVRIATPFFGTGFNFCVDRYFGSFPKVGIIIPNPGQWLLPEFQDIGRTLQTTLQLPPDATIGHGFTLQPTSDGLLISMPSGVQPNNIPDGGVRYGIQIGQAFGYDFGIGIIRDICFISFTTV